MPTTKVNVDSDIHGLMSIELRMLPDTCPICDKGIVPISQGGYFMTKYYTNPNWNAQIIFRCPINSCQSLFIAYYLLKTDGEIHLVLVQPIEPKSRKFSHFITDISSSFEEIFNHSFKSEQMGWIQASGPGYRKALEFLVKDYCIKNSTSDDEKKDISTLLLGPVINKYIKNENIKAIANRAAWLGNDETHYKRLFDNKDLQDLKSLIELTVHLIEMNEMSNQIIQEMPDKKKKS